MLPQHWDSEAGPLGVLSQQQHQQRSFLSRLPAPPLLDPSFIALGTGALPPPPRGPQGQAGSAMGSGWAGGGGGGGGGLFASQGMRAGATGSRAAEGRCVRGAAGALSAFVGWGKLLCGQASF